MGPAIRFTLSLALLLFVSAGAWAKDFEGTGLLTAKDEAAGELKIEGAVYHVSPETVIRAADGSVIELHDVEIPTGEEGLLPISALPTAHFRATRSGDRLELLSLELLPGPE